jgi:hypothetical protein
MGAKIVKDYIKKKIVKDFAFDFCNVQNRLSNSNATFKA